MAEPAGNPGQIRTERVSQFVHGIEASTDRSLRDLAVMAGTYLGVNALINKARARREAENG